MANAQLTEDQLALAPTWWRTCREIGHAVTVLEKSDMADEFFCSDCSRGQSSRKAKRARDEHRGDALVMAGHLREHGETPSMTASSRAYWKARAEAVEARVTDAALHLLAFDIVNDMLNHERRSDRDHHEAIHLLLMRRLQTPADVAAESEPGNMGLM